MTYSVWWDVNPYSVSQIQHIFPTQILGVGTNSPQFLRDGAPHYTKFWEYM